MSAVTNPLRTFRTPAELATYLNTDDKFKKATILSPKGPMCAYNLQNELEGLSEITALSTSALKNSQGFASNSEIKKLIHAYRIFLTNSSATTDKLMAQSITISNNCKTIIDLVNANNNTVAKELLGQTKELFQKSSQMFASLIAEAKALKASEKFLFTVQENDVGAALDPVVTKMGAIQTRLLNSGYFWERVRVDGEFTADLIVAEAFIDVNMGPEAEEQIASISSRWLELVRVTQLVSQSIEGVLTSLKDPLPPESKQSQT